MPKRRSRHRKSKAQSHEVGNGGGENTACGKTSSHEVGNGVEEDTACGDRISNLPIDIIHKIVCKVPIRDAAKTSVLSQRWRSIWNSRPIIYLDESGFGANYSLYTERDKTKRDAFLTYLMKTLATRRDEECEYRCAIDMVVLRTTVVNPSDESVVQKWIDFALTSKAKGLYLSLKTTYSMRYNLLDIAFFSDSLLSLSIYDCKITNCSFMLPSLKTLFLRNVYIEEDDLTDLIAGLPLIEKLSIENSRFLRDLNGQLCFDKSVVSKRLNIVVSNPNLKYFRVHLPGFSSKIQIDSTKLESLEFSETCVDMCVIKITSTATVRNLTLQNFFYDLDSTWINFINQFPLLEKLLIDGCYGNSQNLYVSHQHLTSLVMMAYKRVEEIRIDAPKLKSVEFAGGLVSFTGIRASRDLKFVKFHLKPQKLDTLWYSWLRNLLKSFAHFKHLSLICQNEQAIIFPNELTETLLPTINDLKNLELQIDSSTATSQQILDGFAWILPGLKTLSLTLGSISKVIEFPERG